MSMDYESWRCPARDTFDGSGGRSVFCPPEGCAMEYGCARDKGWDPSQPSPFADPVTGHYRPGGFAADQADIISATGA